MVAVVPRRRSRLQLVLSIALAVLVLVPVGIAIVHRGFAGTEVDANDRDVWVVNANERLAGRLNAQIEELDAAAGASTSAFDVLQDRGSVYLHDDALGTVSRLDPGTGLAVETVSVPVGSDVEIRGGRIGVLERATGSVWIVDAATDLRFDYRTTQPVLQLGPSARLEMTTTGTALVAAVGDQSLYRIAGAHAFPQRIPLGLDLHRFELAAVGDRAVLLDLDSSTIIFDTGRRLALSAEAIHLQESSAPADFVAIATVSEVMLVPFRDDGRVETIGAGASASNASRDPLGIARPMRHEGCWIGAWGSLATVAYQCDGQDDVTVPIGLPLHGGELRFRSAGGVLALNNVATGDAFLPLRNMVVANNWSEVLPLDRRDAAEFAPDDIETPLPALLSARGEANRVPRPSDDFAGVRPGATIVVPVLANDRDPDGDVLTITGVEPLGTAAGTASGRLDVVGGGTELRFTADAGGTGSLAYVYRVSDGRDGGAAEAIVRIHVVDSVENAAPEPGQTPVLRLEQGREGTIDALAGWTDAEGDPVHLVAATGVDDLDVRFTPRGEVTVSPALEPGVYDLAIVASDGRGQRPGTVLVEVAAPGTLPPDTAIDYATGTTSAPVTLDVVRNDPGVGGGPPALIDAAEAQGRAGVSFDPAAGTVTLDARQAGTFEVLYTVQAGALTSLGLARFDVLDPAAQPDVAPVAVPDVAFVQGLQPVTVDLLANDAGDDRVVLGVIELGDTAAAVDAGLRVELLDHALLRLTPTRPLDEALTIPYVLSDGARTDVGAAVVTPVAPITAPRPPVTVPDAITVRAGDIGALAPLANDTQPNGLPLTLEQTLVQVRMGDDGLVDVDGDEVRIKAPTVPGDYTFRYRVHDPLGGRVDEAVTVTVTAPDPAANRPPVPAPVDVRASTGIPVTIDLPLAGTDPDGDLVSIAGVSAAPALGELVSVGAASVTYLAHAPGTDAFTVTVRDAFGATAELPVRVGVVAASSEPVPPTAVDDVVHVAPGMSISVDVLANDSDPRGLGIVLQSQVPAGDSAATVHVDGRALVITPPPGATDFTVPYEIANTAGLASSAAVHVSVRDGAPVPPPAASDHLVAPDALRGLTVVEIDVREGATNPTGMVDELIVELVDASTTASIDGGTVRVQAGGERVIVPFRLTSPVTGASSIGFIVVPPIPRT